MNSMPIGVFDSGVGGLSVFAELVKALPRENYIYYGDTANLPYGDKSKDELVAIAAEIFDFFKKNNVKAVVMACNTTSATVYDELKSKYDFKIYPLVQTVSKFIADGNYLKIGVLATNATVNSHAYKREIQKANPKTDVFEHACPKWVSIVEEQNALDETNTKIIENDLREILKHKVDAVILGCTHYPYLMPVLSKFAPEKLFINPAAYFARSIAKDLESNNMLNSGNSSETEFFVSGNSEKFIAASKLFYDVRTVKNPPVASA